MSAEQRFPFGAPVRDCGVEMPGPVDTFILGAYPSALHVEWAAPNGVSIVALAVDNEPSVFWDGHDAAQRVEEWKSAVRFDAAWGSVRASGNGSSGAWVNDKILRPLEQAGSSSYFITDCLPTYRMSKGGQDAIESRYHPFANDNDLPRAVLATHPSEGQIVSETLNEQRDRLATQIAAARPDRLVTLGDAAARVVAKMADWGGTGKVSDGVYGEPRRIRVVDTEVSWYALVHPAARGDWQPAHQSWLETGGFSATGQSSAKPLPR